MTHEGAALGVVLRGPPALAQGAWTAVAETAQAITDTSRGSGEVALRTRAPGDIRDRVFAAAMEPAVPYDQGDEEDTRKHFSDPARDTAREDRSSEVDGEAHAADVRGDDGSRLTVRDQIVLLLSTQRW